MARGDILLVGLPESDGREEKGNRKAVAVQADISSSEDVNDCSCYLYFGCTALSLYGEN